MGTKDIYTIDYTKSSQLTHVESQILSQYQLLATQLNSLSDEIQQLNSTSGPSGTSARSDGSPDKRSSANDLLDNLRNLEMQISLIYTLFKGAVYSLFLDNEQDHGDIDNGDEDIEGRFDENAQDGDEKEEIASEGSKSPND